MGFMNPSNEIRCIGLGLASAIMVSDVEKLVALAHSDQWTTKEEEANVEWHLAKRTVPQFSLHRMTNMMSIERGSVLKRNCKVTTYR